MKNVKSHFIVTHAEFLALRKIIVDLATTQHAAGNTISPELHKALSIIMLKAPVPHASYVDLLSTDALTKKCEELCEES